MDHPGSKKHSLGATNLESLIKVKERLIIKI
jgi:hypothetical protein